MHTHKQYMGTQIRSAVPPLHPEHEEAKRYRVHSVYTVESQMLCVMSANEGTESGPWEAKSR